MMACQYTTDGPPGPDGRVASATEGWRSRRRRSIAGRVTERTSILEPLDRPAESCVEATRQLSASAQATPKDSPMSGTTTRTRTPALPLAAALAAMTALLVAVAVSFAGSARAAGPPDILLGEAADFSVLASDGITKTGAITVTGLVGSAPTGITGTGVITPSGVERGVADGDVATAKLNLGTAYLQAEGSPTSGTLTGQIGGEILTGGTYTRSGALDFTGVLTLDGENDPNSVFVIQVSSSLTVAKDASVVLTRGAQACHVFWQIGADTVVQTGAAFKGNILGQNDITAATSATFEGRLLTNTGAVTLDNNTITNPVCAAATPAPTATTPAPTASPTKKPTPKPTKTSPSRGGGSGNADDSDDSSGGSGSDSGSDSDGTSTGTSDGGSDGDGNTPTSTPGLPDTGGPPWFLAPAGALVVLAGLGVVIAARTPRGMHRG
jgi:hypothetical protein